ncbi:MAG: relaxase/mobilization nuclease domain-containing protein [Prevotella sp.]|nr:relaxase/mobilization nuclease domain-containing protein [Prevotella sp.]
MIAKIVKGASFRGCVQYVTGKDEAKILASDGVLLGSVGNIADSFEYQRALNPKCSKPVGHIALSFKPEDKEKLTDGMMAKIAREYMELMGIKDTQFILVRHHNTANPHCHLVYNRVDNNGRIISDKFERKHSEKIVKHLKDKYGLTYSDSKGQTRTERLHYTERTKFEIQNAVKTALQASRTWQQFTDRLKQQGIEVEFKRRSGSDDVIEGITFIKDGVRFKGSQIGRQFTYAKLNERLSWEEQRQTTHQGQTGQTRQNEQPMQEPNPDYQGTSHSTFDFPSLGLFDTNNPVYDPAEEEFRRRMQRKKKKRGPRL